MGARLWTRENRVRVQPSYPPITADGFSMPSNRDHVPTPMNHSLSSEAMSPAHRRDEMQVRICFPNQDGSFSSQKFRLPRRRHLTRVLDRYELFRCPKCLKVFPYDFGCDTGSTPEARLWCDACWSKHDREASGSSSQRRGECASSTVSQCLRELRHAHVEPARSSRDSVNSRSGNRSGWK